MQYAILCYHDEQVVGRWTPEEDAACMRRLDAVQDKMARAGKLGPVARLHPTGAATTLRKSGGAPVVLDGPFAETKEQFLGFYIVDCESMAEAQAFANELSDANPGGCYEIRPVGLYRPVPQAAEKTLAAV